MTASGWRTFVTVCDEGSLSAAALVLGFSQSAISRQVAALEQELGTLLLERLPRGVRPTAAGQALLPHARLVVGEVGRARESVRRAAQGGGGAVSLGAVPSATADLVPRALGLFRDRVSEERCLLRSGVSPDLVDRVLTGDLDLAVVTDYPPGLPRVRGLQRSNLLHDEMGVIVPVGHRLAGRRRRVRIADLADEVWAEDNPGSERILRQTAGRAGFEPRIELEAGDLLGKVGLVAAGLAVALAPGLLTPSLPTSVCRIRLVEPPVRAVYAVHRTDSTRNSVGILLEALKVAAEPS